MALDTSVLARLILCESPAEFELARQTIAENRCSLSWSVLIELCWVLERSAKLPRHEVHDGLYAISRMANIALPDQAKVDWVLGRYAAGADFADMVHLVTAVPGSSRFATFDRKLARQASGEASLEIMTLRV